MPTCTDPRRDAAEASEALRGLAHASRAMENPADTYPILGELLAGVRSLRQSLDQLATAHLTHRGDAHDDAGDQAIGTSEALAAADNLHQAGTVLDSVEERLDAATTHSGRIAWHPAHTVAGHDRVERQWISVVFLQGDEADEILDLVDRDGPDAAIDHLKGFDYGEETTDAALINGYVYDTPPAGALDREATDGDYLLLYNHQLGHVSLLRRYTTDPVEEESTAVAREAIGGINAPPRHTGMRMSPSPTRAAVRESETAWFAPARPSSASSAERGLGR
ncbi:hypothetical protein [Kocuria carniphila]|uniref:hypothetical protein n=1 Tax=Kocuria carniphila TaxID=262208 RepID=UPI0028EC4321|nr:hypothetical protein [Kocuria carniphila]